MNPPYHIVDHDQVTVVTLDFENLDGGICPRLREELVEKLKSSKQVVLNVERIQFADTSGLGLIRELAAQFPQDCFALSKVGTRLGRCLTRIPENKIPPIFGKTENKKHVDPKRDSAEKQSSAESETENNLEKEVAS